ncbi:hypothetical protein EBQ74_04090 [bacterium]|nr:hypothetical protein [bacterium]
MTSQNKRLIFHGEADSIRGTGHLVRAVGLAGEVNKSSGGKYQVETFTNNPDLVKQLFIDWKSLEVLEPLNYFFPSLENQLWSDKQKNNFIEVACNIPRSNEEEWFISDNKYDLKYQDIEKLYSRFDRLIFVDNASCVDKSIDALIVPHDFCDLKPANSPLIFGPDWLWLNPSIESTVLPGKNDYDYSIFMGGADPHQLTLEALKDLRALYAEKKLQILVCIGPYNHNLTSINQFVREHPSFDISLEMASGRVVDSLSRAEVCLVAFGLTGIELEFLGKHTVFYSHHEQHRLEMERYLKLHPEGSKSRDSWRSGDHKWLKTQRKQRPNVGQTFLNTFQL